MTEPRGPEDDPTVIFGADAAGAGEPARGGGEPSVAGADPTRVQPAAGGGGGGAPLPPPGLGGGGYGDGPGPNGAGRDARQRALLAAAGVLAIAIIVVVVLLATHSNGSTTASGSSTTAAPSTTVAATTTTAAPSTTSTLPATTTTTTTVPPPATTVAPTPQAALNAIAATLGPTYAVSPIAGQDKSMFAAIDHPAAQSGGGSTVVVDVYQYLNGAWQPQASVPLGADGSTGLLLPASQHATPITVTALTGSADPDYAVTTASASALITTIVSDQTGKWRAVPFQAPSGTVIGVPDAIVRQTTIAATFNSCTPTCATGGAKQVTFAYKGGTFVPLAG
ncbi:hypothetical protein K6U06_02625 [Acidiferrimicrobium sp. IK]|uniref:hypothetical protein n=1 Tax=Acidiferrimicrobium sp. IK TaxID=2871700 RepID=UPI0021CB8C99|nr:hypothetical protein [Acidiferrimicrobium sp. IK]MCU4183240.1 hypothetical protein [Acidiferrimicrobium sp. IK]